MPHSESLLSERSLLYSVLLLLTICLFKHQYLFIILLIIINIMTIYLKNKNQPKQNKIRQKVHRKKVWVLQATACMTINKHIFILLVCFLISKSRRQNQMISYQIKWNDLLCNQMFSVYSFHEFDL